MTDRDSPRPKKPRRPRAPKAPKQRPPAETVDSAQRLFLAVPLPEPVVTLVDTMSRSLQAEEWPVRWTAPGNAHVTLHFLGEVEPERGQLLRLALRSVIALHDRFDLRTADLGVFPNMKRPRIIWLGLYGPAHRLHTLRDAIGDLLVSFDFELAEGEFHPHITLGRVRDARKSRVRDLPAAIRARLEAAAASGEVTHKEPIPVPVDEVVLVQSHLGKDGPRYEVLERYPLRAAES
ncbi:MAG: RNA 2',3'-cyclic phosphodiesterase [Chloroflexia bacterium]|nr:RNA 2',3'-cyclic phosphodiesterase [Chloroflexia bacterium]